MIPDNAIDLRSDTVTKPSPAMMEAMQNAPLGDDVYGGDPTVMELERRMAEITNMEAALFVSSGTQSNLVALMAHCQRGDEFIVGDQFHIFKNEACGSAVLGSLAPHPLPTPENGQLSLEQVENAIRPDDIHCPITRLLCLENTFNGIAIPLVHQNLLADFAHERGLKVHLDGARLFNACADLQVTPADMTEKLDSVSICLSKGLGAPVGSVLCGDRDFIDRGRRIRKMLGGGMRQAGLLAICGLIALDEEVPRLEEDHQNAAILAAALKELPGLEVAHTSPQTNMVWVSLEHADQDALVAALLRHNIVITPGGKRTRLTLHRDVSSDQVETVIEAFRSFYGEAARA